VNRGKLGDMVAYIKKTLLHDWNNINFVIGTNPEDMIEIKFDKKTIDSIPGLHAYMNNLINTDDEIVSYDLRWIVYYWGYAEKKYLYYMLAPVWVHLWVNDIVNMTFSKELLDNESEDSLSESNYKEKREKQFAKLAEEKKPILYSKDIEID